MTDPLTPEREQEIRDSIPTVYGPPWTVHPDMEDGTWRVLYATDHPLAGLVAEVPDYGSHLAEFIATARAAVPELLAELDRLRDELAEVEADQNPRLRCLIVKAAPERDLYVGWSNVCEMPAGMWTRAEAIAYEQRGWLRRDRLGDYAELWLADRQDEAFDLLEPFEGETEVRR
jgi:hypothetical protein